MAQPLRNRDGVDVIENKHRSHRVPELVWVDMGEAVLLREAVEVCRDTVRVHWRSVVLGEEKVIVVPVVIAEVRCFLGLVILPFPKEFNCLWRDCNPSDRGLGLRCTLVDADIRRMQDAIADVKAAAHKVHVFPSQAQHFTAAASCDH